VYIDLLGITVEEEKRKRIAGGRHQVVVRGRQGVHQQLVADEAPVDKQVNRIPVELLDLRPGDKSADCEHALAAGFIRTTGKREASFVIAEVHQILQDLCAEY